LFQVGDKKANLNWSFQVYHDREPTYIMFNYHLLGVIWILYSSFSCLRAHFTR